MKAGQLYRFVFTLFAVIIIGISSVPANAHTNGGAQTHQNCPLNPEATHATHEVAASKEKPKAKAKEKCIFDADVLESPLSLFRHANAEDDNSEAAPQVNALAFAVRALIATLLSTVL